MDRSEIVALQQEEGYPFVSILARTHRTSPDNKKDPVKVKNLVEEARNRLLAERDKREVAVVLEHLEGVVDEIDWAHTLDGLVIYANVDGARVFYLPYAVESRVVVDATWATRDLVASWARSESYRVLVLSEKPTRLYHAVRDDLEEVVGYGFPFVHDAPGGNTRLPGGAGINPATIRQNHHLEFFKQIDKAISDLQNQDGQPLVVVGVQRYLGYWDQISRNNDAVIAKVEGAHAKTPPHELGGLVWPQVKDVLRQRREATAAAVRDAVGQGDGEFGLASVWRAAAEGRVRVLAVDEGYKQPATVDDSGLELTFVEDATAPGVLDDAVDELVEAVIAKGGDVVFVQDKLADLQHVAASLRY